MSADQGRTTTPFSELRANLSPEAQERAAARTQEIVSQMDPVVDGGRDHAINAALDAAEALQERVASLEAQIKLACEECTNMILADDWSADGAFARRVLVLLLAPRTTATEEPTPTPTATEGK